MFYLFIISEVRCGNITDTLYALYSNRSVPAYLPLSTHSHTERVNFDLSRSGPSSSPLAVDAAERKNRD